jgi:signal transduction histidine kinase
VLFVIAILIPAAVLVGLGLRVVRQEAELARTRLVEDRRRATTQLARELTATLEAIRLQEVNRLIREPGLSLARPAHPATVLIAEIRSDRLVPPWERAEAARTDRSHTFEDRKRLGEAAEFARKDFPAAARSYREALAAASRPSETGEARLLLARAEMKAGRVEHAFQTYRELLADAGSGLDDEGVPYRAYAAERMLATGRDADAVYAYVMADVNDGRLRSPAELYVLQSILQTASGEPADRARTQLAALIRKTDMVTALAKDLERVRSRVESGGSGWMAYGDEPWLVTVTPAAPPLPGLLFAISTSTIAAPGVRLVSTSPQGLEAKPPVEPLGEALAGLGVAWGPDQFVASPDTSATVPMYAAGLALALGFTILGGYLLLRDVNRDMHVAEMRSQFVASVSHELKTPLTAIRMFAETLALGRSKDPRMQTEYLETIVNECERLARLVDNVLDFSKIEQGKKIYRMQPTNLAQVARSAARTMQYPLSQQGFSLRVSIDDEVPELPADADAMEQAILNLLTNAMKYSGEARDIELRLARQNGAAVIEVQDHGLGIPREEQARIFEKYYRVRAPETMLVAGTGLGLTLVSHIVNAHGGRLELSSEPNTGSTFSILLPLPAPAEAVHA